MKEPEQVKRRNNPIDSVNHYNRIGQLDHIEHLRLHPPAQPWQPPQRQTHRSQRYGYDAQQRLTSEVVHSHRDGGVMSAVRISFIAEFQPRFFKVQPFGAGF